jgi:RNA ligase
MTTIFLSDLMSFTQLNDRLSAGYVTARDHTFLPLSILNYTPKAQYERLWDDVTTQCRGLIVHSKTGEVIARPFPKFFNVGEHDDLPTDLPDLVHDKLDGSLGIAYSYDGCVGIATRGSFVSEQALWANEWLARMHRDWRPQREVTHLFEIIYPDNRIVVNYGERAELVLLAEMHIRTGEELDTERSNWPGAKVDAFEPDDLELLAKACNERDNSEGFVCTWRRKNAPALRVKLKADEYVRLHRVVTGLSNRTVWEHLAAGTIDQLRDDTPDEFYQWFDEQVDALLSEHRDIVECAQVQLDTLTTALPGADRKLLAEAIQQSTTYPGLCFALLDGKDISERVWRMVKPERETALVSASEDA